VARYQIVPERSQMWIEGRSSLHPIHANTSGLEGFIDIEFDAAGEVNLTAPPTGQLSLDVTRLNSGNRVEDRELQRRINSRRYPTIDGVLDQIARDGADGQYTVSGAITFRGVSRQYEDLMEIHAVDDQTVQLGGSSKFDIRDFGMEPPRLLLLKVEPEVEIRVEIFAERKA
jgi:polyisoprenoid-binding protein YceI